MTHISFIFSTPNNCHCSSVHIVRFSHVFFRFTTLRRLHLSLNLSLPVIPKGTYTNHISNICSKKHTLSAFQIASFPLRVQHNFENSTAWSSTLNLLIRYVLIIHVPECPSKADTQKCNSRRATNLSVYLHI